MTSSDVWGEAAAARYDTASGMFDPAVVTPTVDRLAALAGGGRALEFAIGTGRVAVPLAARGVPVVIEVGVPQLRRLPPGQAAVPFDISDAHLGFDTYDLVTQQATSHHLSREPDGSYRRGTHHYRYVWPAELDLMARLAGLMLEDRAADWRGNPFTVESPGHVSTWSTR